MEQSKTYTMRKKKDCKWWPAYSRSNNIKKDCKWWPAYSRSNNIKKDCKWWPAFLYRGIPSYLCFMCGCACLFVCVCVCVCVCTRQYSAQSRVPKLHYIIQKAQKQTVLYKLSHKYIHVQTYTHISHEQYSNRPNVPQILSSLFEGRTPKQIATRLNKLSLYAHHGGDWSEDEDEQDELLDVYTCARRLRIRCVCICMCMCVCEWIICVWARWAPWCQCMCKGADN